MATHSSPLAWKIPWTEEPGRLYSPWDSKESHMTEQTSLPSQGLMHALQHSVPPTLHQATADPRLHRRLLDTYGQVWVSLLWGHWSFLLSPSVHKVFFVPSESVSQSCVSSGGSMVVLMATSSERTYAIPRSSAPRVPAPAAVQC